MEVRILALGMERVGMESSRARRTRSVWVVALQIVRCELPKKSVWTVQWEGIPEWISDYKECDIDFVGVFENIITR